MIREAIDQEPEVITFQVEKTIEGQRDKTQLFKKEHAGNYTKVDRAAKRKYQKMLPNHLCIWRRDLIKTAFPPNMKSEDLKWADKMDQFYSKEGQHHIDQVLYYYQFSRKTTETQQRR